MAGFNCTLFYFLAFIGILSAKDFTGANSNNEFGQRRETPNIRVPDNNDVNAVVPNIDRENPILESTDGQLMNEILMKVIQCTQGYVENAMATGGFRTEDLIRVCLTNLKSSEQLGKTPIQNGVISNTDTLPVNGEPYLQGDPHPQRKSDLGINEINTNGISGVVGFLKDPVDKRIGKHLSVNGALSSLAEMLRSQSRRNPFRHGYKHKLLKLG